MDSLIIFLLLTVSAASSGRPKVEIYEVRQNDRTGQLYVDDKYVYDKQESPLLSLFKTLQDRKPYKSRAKDRVVKDLVEKIKYKLNDNKKDWLNNLVYLIKLNESKPSNKVALEDDDNEVKRYKDDNYIDNTRTLSRLKKLLSSDRDPVLYRLSPKKNDKHQYDISAGPEVLRSYLRPNQYKTAPPFMAVLDYDPVEEDRDDDLE